MVLIILLIVIILVGWFGESSFLCCVLILSCFWFMMRWKIVCVFRLVRLLLGIGLRSVLSILSKSLGMLVWIGLGCKICYCL